MSPEEPRSLVQKDRSSDDHIESRREGKADPVWWEESRQFINLAVPSIIVEVGLTIPLALTASYVGRHLGPVYLGGFTLATLTGNLLTLSLLWGLYSASDTLSPQAFGAGNYKEVGMVAMRGVIGSFIILVPINSALFFFMEDLLLFCGEDPEASRLAAQWYRVYMFALPFYALYMVTWKFLSAQEIMRPLIIALFVAVGVVLPVSLQVLVPSLGFMGSAIAVLIYQISHPLLLLGYLAWKQPHHPETWPGIECWKDALTWEPLKIFLQLGFGGMLACGEWMWWEFVSLIIGTLGVIPLTTHSIPTQVLTVIFMLPMGIGTALAIRLGSTLPRNVARAKQLAFWSIVIAVVLFGLISVFAYTFRHAIFDLFTHDPQVLELAEAIWLKVSVYCFFLCIFGVFSGLAVGLGMQWSLGLVCTFFLWIVALPGLYLHSVTYDGGFVTAWNWIYPPYLFMNIVLLYQFLTSSWDDISREIRVREGIEDMPLIGSDGTVVAKEDTPLLLQV